MGMTTRRKWPAAVSGLAAVALPVRLAKVADGQDGTDVRRRTPNTQGRLRLRAGRPPAVTKPALPFK